MMSGYEIRSTLSQPDGSDKQIEMKDNTSSK